MDYHLGIDHNCHDVTYAGYPQRMADLPGELRCRRIELGGDDDLVEGIVARTSREDGFEKVLALSEFGMLESWRIRQHLGIAGPSLAQIERVRDKVIMKEALAGSGIRYPRFVPVPSVRGQLPWSGRTVVKPRKGASSEGVSVHRSAGEALIAYAKLPNQVDYQLEEYVEGDILHADGLVCDGVLVNLVVSKYVNKPIDFVDGRALGSYQLPRNARYHAFAARVVEVLEIEAGCLHLEFFETAGQELVFLEVANRMGGAGVVGAHARHCGIHLPSHEISIRLGLRRPEPMRPSGRYHGWLVFSGHHLGARGPHLISVPNNLRSHPCVDNFNILGPHEQLPDHITYQEWLAPVFIEASHRDQMVLGEFFRECVDSISVELRKAS